MRAGPASTPRTAVVLGLVLLAMSGCANPLAKESAAGKAWVGTSSTSTVMVQMTRTDQTLTGTLDSTSVDGGAGTSVQPTHLAFTGTVQDNAITLSFPGGLGTVTTFTGTLTPSVLTLQIPQEDGSVAPIELRPGTLDDYNEAVAGLRDQADANTAEQAEAAADQQEADQRSRRETAITSAADTVISDHSALSSALAKPPSFDSFATHLREAEKNLAAARKNAAAAGRKSDTYDACSAAYDAQSSAYDVAGNGYDIDSDVSDLATAVGDIKQAVTTLEDDLARYEDAVAGLPGFTPARRPDVSGITATVQKAATKTAAWTGTGKSYQRQVAALIKKATTVAEAAQKKYCG
jgi:hypothetical protein